MRRLPLCIAATVLLAITTIAQNQPSAFETASVKPGTPTVNGGQRGISGVPSAVQVEGHRFVARNLTVYSLIKWGYGIGGGICAFDWECDLLSGGPSWVKSGRFEIQAMTPDDAPVYTFAQLRDHHAPQLRAMIQTSWQIASSSSYAEK